MTTRRPEYNLEHWSNGMYGAAHEGLRCLMSEQNRRQRELVVD